MAVKNTSSQLWPHGNWFLQCKLSDPAYSLQSTIPFFIQVENLFRVYNEKRNFKIEAQKTRRYSSKPSPNTSRVPSPEEIIVPADSDAG